MKDKKILFLIFVFGLVLRFIYYPKDISFGYDQARDAYTALHAMSGDLKVLGPPASVAGIYHGALIYYILGPLYKIFSGSPFGVAAVFRIVNAFGILLTFSFLKTLFKSDRTSLLGAFLFALSFEQSQFSLFLGHPALGVITVLLFYIGIARLIFSKKATGLYLASLGLGLTIQFHFSSVSLFAVLLIVLFVFRKEIPKVNFKQAVASLSIFVFTLSSYIISEFKYGFRTVKTLSAMYTSGNSGSGLKMQNILDIPSRLFKDNLVDVGKLSILAILLLFAFSFWIAKKKKRQKQIVFLAILFFLSVIPYVFYVSVQPSFYYSLGASVLIIALASFVIDQLLDKKRILGYSLLIAVALSNIGLITKYNPTGTVAEVNAQEGMLLTDALKVVDFTYEKSSGKEFSVSAVTIPYNINTTWSYLYGWYGEEKYGYLPVWGGENAAGYDNVLLIETAQSKLPPVKFTIIEPPKGLTGPQIDTFLGNEDIFWSVFDKARFGQFTVQYRVSKIEPYPGCS